MAGPQEPTRRAQSLLRSKRTQVDLRRAVGGTRWKSRVLGSAEALLGGKARSESTVNKSTDRLGPSARVELSSKASGFKRSRRRRGAGDTTRARVGGFAWVKKPSGTCSGRVLHRFYLSTRSQDQRIGHRGGGDKRTGARLLCKRARGWWVLRDISCPYVFLCMGLWARRPARGSGSGLPPWNHSGAARNLEFDGKQAVLRFYGF